MPRSKTLFTRRVRDASPSTLSPARRALGVVTALAAPLTYPLSFALAWPDPNASGAALWAAASDPELYEMVRWLAYNEVMVPCLAVTGAVSGLLLHVGLEHERDPLVEEPRRRELRELEAREHVRRRPLVVEEERDAVDVRHVVDT